MSGRLEGKVAVITGAASGLGEATARRFVEEGASVVLGDIQEDLGEAVVAQLGDAAVFRRCDVTVEDDVAGLVDAAVETFGRLDVMMNNAGIVGALGPIAMIPAEEFKFTMDVLLTGTFYGMKHAARVMQPQGSGSIINLASSAGVQGGLGPHVYTAAKHGVVGLTKNVAAELCRSGIRVNCLAPGSTATPLVAKAHLDDHEALKEVEAALAEESPIKGRAGMPIDVANAALYLACEESGNTNGHCLSIDGGVVTGSTADDPPFAEPMPLMREAGRTGI
jgi:NAD(P)-dependent dehydrogenase (short-subunit alcohol dehydrogenase family)